MSVLNEFGKHYDSIVEYEILSFLAVGGQSVVFQVRKYTTKRTCALKVQAVDPQFMNFEEFELNVFGDLEQCSTSKLHAVIREIPQKTIRELVTMIPPDKMETDGCKRLRNSSISFFGVVEDFIFGSDLRVWCQGGVFGEQQVPRHTPGRNASYDQVVQFQRTLLSWTKQFCEIMMQVSGKHGYLHLDIKPENLMLTGDTNALIVIDFGNAVQLTGGDSLPLHEAFSVDAAGKIGLIGTQGYAAPECCYSEMWRNALQFHEPASVDVRSDIFSFGATLWACVNPDDIIDVDDADGRNLRPDLEDLYFRRDLFHAPQGYIQEFEDMIVRCTAKDPRDRYQSYEDLRKAAENVERKLAARDKPSVLRTPLRFLAVVFSVALVLAIFFSARLNALNFEVAQSEFRDLCKVYTNSDITEFREKALAYVDADPLRNETYDDILSLASGAPSYAEGADTVTKDELGDVLLPCLSRTLSTDIKINYLNSAFSHTSAEAVAGLSDAVRSEFVKSNSILSDVSDCDGMRLAKAVYSCNHQKDDTDFTERYSQIYRELLILSEKESASYDYSEPLFYIVKQLKVNQNEATKTIADELGNTTADEVQKKLNEIVVKFGWEARMNG